MDPALPVPEHVYSRLEACGHLPIGHHTTRRRFRVVPGHVERHQDEVYEEARELMQVQGVDVMEAIEVLESHHEFEFIKRHIEGEQSMIFSVPGGSVKIVGLDFDRADEPAR